MSEQDFDRADAACIERFLQGDNRAFEDLVYRRQRSIYNLALRYLRTPEEAQEATQEIFVKVFRSLAGFRRESRFSTWLFTVAVNHCKNRLKYLNRRRYYASEPLDPPPDCEDDAPPRQFAAAGPDPNAQALTNEAQVAVRRAIDELSDDHREVIVLRDLQGLSYEEIAAATNEAVGTVKSRIHRARLELARKLQPFVDAEGV
jgi:RNA polymerase sigma-70 factor (ECF subfamily)